MKQLSWNIVILGIVFCVVQTGLSPIATAQDRYEEPAVQVDTSIFEEWDARQNGHNYYQPAPATKTQPYKPMLTQPVRPVIKTPQEAGGITSFPVTVKKTAIRRVPPPELVQKKPPVPSPVPIPQQNTDVTAAEPLRNSDFMDGNLEDNLIEPKMSEVAEQLEHYAPLSKPEMDIVGQADPRLAVVPMPPKTPSRKKYGEDIPEFVEPVEIMSRQEEDQSEPDMAFSISKKEPEVETPASRPLPLPSPIVMERSQEARPAQPVKIAKIMPTDAKTKIIMPEASAPPVPRPPANADTRSLSLTFAQDETDISDPMIKEVRKDIIPLLLHNPEMRLEIKAFASDNDGNARRTSLSRALSIRSYMIGNGIESRRIDVKALGSENEDGFADRADLLIIDPSTDSEEG